jgi:hypothetical protein
VAGWWWARITQVDEQIPVDTQLPVGYRLADDTRLSYNPEVSENKAIPGSNPGARNYKTRVEFERGESE